MSTEYKGVFELLKQREEFSKHVVRFKQVIEHILRENLKIKTEQLLIISDQGYPTRLTAPFLCALTHEVAQQENITHDIVMQRKPKKVTETVDESVIEALVALPEKSVIFCLLSEDMGNLDFLGSFRKYAMMKQHRFVIIPFLSTIQPDSLTRLHAALDTDYLALHNIGLKIKQLLDNGNELKVVFANGDECVFDIRLKQAVVNDGQFTDPAQGGYLPAGEVIIAPRKIGVNGSVFVDEQVELLRESMVLEEEPLEIEVFGGKILGMQGGASKLLKKDLDQLTHYARDSPSATTLSSFGLGINQDCKLTKTHPKLRRATKGLKSMGIGSNVAVGGTVAGLFKLILLVREAKVLVDGEELNVEKIVKEIQKSPSAHGT